MIYVNYFVQRPITVEAVQKVVTIPIWKEFAQLMEIFQADIEGSA